MTNIGEVFAHCKPLWPMLVRAFLLAQTNHTVDARQCAEQAIDLITHLVELLNDSFPKIPPTDAQAVPGPNP